MKRTFWLLVLLTSLVTAFTGTAVAIQVYSGPTEVTGTVVQVFSGNTFAIFDGERTSVVALEGVSTPKRGDEEFYESASYLHDLLYHKTVRVEITRKAKHLSYGVVTEMSENINVNAQVLAQPYAKEMIDVSLGGAVASMTLRGNEFYSTSVGLRMTKPDDWVFLSADDIETDEENTRLDDRELERLVRNRENTPLVVIVKHPEPYEGLNPSVSVLAKSAGGLLGNDPVELMQSTVSQFQKSFSDFTIIEGIDRTQISGLGASYMKVKYTIVDGQGRTFKTVSRIYLIPRGPVMIMVSLSSLAAEEPKVADAFDKMMASFKMAR